MKDEIYVTIRLDDHPTPQGRVVNGWRPSGSVVVTEKPVHLELDADDPGVLRDFGYALIDLADDLEEAQRPYVGDEDAERGAEA